MSGLVGIFSQVLERSVSVLAVMAVVLLARALLHRHFQRITYALWAVVGLRLVLPVSLPSPMSLFNLEGLRTAQSAAALDALNPSAVASTLGNGTAGLPAGGAGDYVPLVGSALELLAAVWLAGVVLLLLYGLVNFLRLRRSVSTAVCLEGNVWQCDTMKTPFVLGVFRPRIYLPFRLCAEERDYILLHERTHIARRDPLVKPLAFVLLAAYWFHPGVWLSWLCLGRDMERCCDEAVLRTLGSGVKTAYSRSLLDFATDRRFPAPSPLAFGEHDASARIRHVLRWKKAAPAVTFLAVALCILAAVVCGTDAVTPLGGGQEEGWVQAEELSAGGEAAIGSFTVDCPEETRSFVLYQEIYTDGQRQNFPMILDGFDAGVTARHFTLDITGQTNLATGQVGYEIHAGGTGATFSSGGGVEGAMPATGAGYNVWDTEGKEQAMGADEDLILMVFALPQQDEFTLTGCEALMDGSGLEKMVESNARVVLLRLRLSTKDMDTTVKEIEGESPHFRGE